ncbi:MAG: HNH endonuclease signature motif containing protein [Candidatus Dormibacteria bacterium]
MCDRDGEIEGEEDTIGRLARATDCVRRRPRITTPVALRDDLIRLRRIIDRIELEFSTVAGAFAATEEEEWQGCLSPPHWMRLECGMSAAAATSAIAVGSQAGGLAASIAAVEEGRLGFAHLALMAGTARALQDSPTATPFVEQPLLERAMSHTLSRFRVDCAHARHAHDAQAFQAEQLKDVEYRTLDLRTGEGGAVFIKGFLDPVGGAALCTALDPLARRAGTDDDRSRSRRYADALIELAGHGLDTALLPRVGGQRPHLQVTTSLDTLVGAAGAPAGMLERAGPISTPTVQRLACDASVTRVLLGPDAAVVDVGRARRLPSAPTRRALDARHGGCEWPGCDRPTSWTAAHHIKHWAKGGATDLDNLVLVCHRHHWLVHEGGWKLVRGVDGLLMSVAPLPVVRWQARPPDPTVTE